ncbi:MAG: phage tail sheath C-terminal domain-containing protein [Planctomycetota bacterium]
MTFIGINIREVDGSGSPTIVGAATSIAGFNILTQRGVANTPIRVNSYEEFAERFGGYIDGAFGAYLLRGFFLNGGATAYVNRVVSNDAVTGHAPASITLQDAAPADTLVLEAGYLGQPDPGSWGDRLRVAVTHTATATTRLRETAAATVTGTVALAAATDMSAFGPLTLRIDGETTDTVITFEASDFPSAGAAAATREEIRDAINARGNRVVASLNGANNIVLTSTGEVASLSGGWTSIEVRAVNAVLGFAVAPAVFGTAAVPAGTGVALHSVEGFQIGDAIRIRDTTTPANTALAKLLTANETTGAVTWTTNIAAIAGWDLRAIVVENVRFDLAIGLGEPDGVVETLTGLSMESDIADYAVARINDRITGSRYVMATDAASASPAGADLPAETAGEVTFDPGRDGVPTAQEFIGDPAAHTGFSAFDTFDVQLLTCERTDSGIARAGMDYCANRGDCTYVGAVPEGYVEVGQAGAYGQGLQGSKVYGALYGPWVRVVDPIGVGDNPERIIPPVGHILGTFARIDTNRGIWKAPAGDEANLRGVLDVTYRLSDAEHTDLVENGSVNGIRWVPRSGIVVDASRTLSTDTRWLYVNVRLLFNFVKSSLRDGLRWVRQEPNRDTLWKTIKFNSVTPFLTQLWRQGAFGTGSPEEVFTVTIDASNNPPSEVDIGNLNVEVLFYPSRPAEKIIITVGQQQSGATATES